MYATRKRQGFTLVELLVVIAIISLLAAIQLPILQTMRENAKTVICSFNIQQINLALAAYETQNRSFPCGDNAPPITLTPPGGYVGDGTDKYAWWWFHFIGLLSEKDLHKRKVLWCPSRRIKDIGITPNILLGNYGVNQAICKSPFGLKDREIVGTPLSSQQIPQPARTVLVMDSGYSVLNWFHATDTLPSSVVLSKKRTDSGYVPGLWPKSRGENHRSGTEFDAHNGRHPQKSVNTGFVDGHVARLKADDFYVEKTADGYTNRSPLWLP
jgi:prepilin-type N-terminal cleavage/methylation domain-containing protein/prepilin-type processing-associated H-X9-DG protein